MSDTPRTDAVIVESILCTEGGDEECTVYPVVDHVEADFARELEREVARLKEWNAQRTGGFACTEQKLATQIAYLTVDRERLDWLDQHCAFVADSEFKIGPYKVGELRKMADDGIAQNTPTFTCPDCQTIHARKDGFNYCGHLYCHSCYKTNLDVDANCS